MTHIYWELLAYVWASVFFLGFALPFVVISSRELAGEIYKSLTRPMWAPPPAVLGVIWFILYSGEAVAYTIVRLHSNWEGTIPSWALAIFWLLQVAMMLWTPFMRCSFLWSWLSVAISLILAVVDTVLIFYIDHISAWAFWIMVVLDVWLLFMLFLSSSLWWYNRHVDLCQRCEKLRIQIVPE